MFMEVFSITNNGPKYWNGTQNYLSLNEHQTNDPPEKDTHTIGEKLVMCINPEIFVKSITVYSCIP